MIQDVIYGFHGVIYVIKTCRLFCESRPKRVIIAIQRNKGLSSNPFSVLLIFVFFFFLFFFFSRIEMMMTMMKMIVTVIKNISKISNDGNNDSNNNNDNNNNNNNNNNNKNYKNSILATCISLGYLYQTM